MKLALATLGLLTLTAASASATPYLVYPVTGDAFRAEAPANQSSLYYDYGYLYNTGSNTVDVEAPLGHGTGSLTSFTLSGYNTAGHTLMCNILLRSSVTGATYPGTPASWSSAGFFQLPMVSPSVAVGEYTFNVSCLLPPNDATIVFGLTPTGTSSYFTPITGDSFHSQDALEDVNLEYNEAIVFTSSAHGPQWIEGSLGYGQGGTQGFYFNGYNISGASMTCYVEVIDYTNFAAYQYSNTTSGVGYFHTLVNTTAPSGGHYIYTAGCLLPTGSTGGPALWVSGVTPSTGNINLFLPTSGDAFHANITTAQSNLAYSYGALETNANGQTAEGSLGHYIGAGTSTFTVTGYNAGGSGVRCNVSATTQTADNNNYEFSAATSVLGHFKLQVVANPPSGNYVYDVACYMDAAGSYIYGVTPSQ